MAGTGTDARMTLFRFTGAGFIAVVLTYGAGQADILPVKSATPLSAACLATLDGRTDAPSRDAVEGCLIGAVELCLRAEDDRACLKDLTEQLLVAGQQHSSLHPGRRAERADDEFERKMGICKRLVCTSDECRALPEDLLQTQCRLTAAADYTLMLHGIVGGG